MPNYVYKFLLDKNGQIVYPRTPLSAIDVTTTNGIQISGDTMSVVFATKEQIAAGEPGHVISADGLKEAIAAYGNVFYTAGGGIDIQGGTVFAKPAPILSILDGTKDRGDSVANANLNGALNLGRAVDVTTMPPTKNYYSSNNPWTVSTYEEYTGPEGNQVKDDCYQLQHTAPSTIGYMFWGWNVLPKFAANLRYLIIADVKCMSGSVRCGVGSNASGKDFEICDKDGVPITKIQGTQYSPFLTSEWTRQAKGLTYDHPDVGIWFYNTTTDALDVRVKHYMVFEVTALSDEAIYALATMEHPEDVYAKYLVKKDAVCPWINIINMQYSAVVTIGAGLSYKLYANDGNDHTLMVDTFPENAYGKDSFITLFVGEAEHILVQSPLVLMDPLTPNAVNNCIVKFRDGYARIYVSDTDYGYTVTVTSGSTDGSLKYGLVNTTEEYIVIAGTLDGERISFDGAVVPANRKTNILGHGTDKTTLTGDVAPVATMEMHQLSLADVNVTGGTMIVPSGVEVASGGSLTAAGGLTVFSGGSIASGGTAITSNANLVISSATIDGVLRCSGGISLNGSGTIQGSGIIDLCSAGRLRDFRAATESLSITGMTITGGSVATGSYGGVFEFHGNNTLYVSNCLFTSNHAQYGGVIHGHGVVTFEDCTFRDNTASGLEENGTVKNTNGVLYCQTATHTISNCFFDKDQYITLYNGSLRLLGSNATLSRIRLGGTQSVVYANSDTIIDVIGNSISMPVSAAASNGIVMQDNVRILYNHDSAGNVLPTSSVTEISGGTYGGITNYGVLRGPVTASSGEIISGNGTVIDLSDATSAIIVSGTAYISGCTVTRSSTVAISDGGLFVVSAGNTLSAFDCVLSGASANYGGGLWLTGSANLTSCTGRELRGAAGGGYYLRGGKLTISGCDLLGTMMCRSASDIKFTGSNRFGGRIIQWVGSTDDTTATVTIAPGAIIDLRGNTNTTPIAPGGGITFAAGGQTILHDPSGGVASSAIYNFGTTPVIAKAITNGGAIAFDKTLIGGNVVVSGTAVITGGTFTTSGVTTAPEFSYKNAEVTLTDVCTEIYLSGSVYPVVLTISGTLRMTKAYIWNPTSNDITIKLSSNTIIDFRGNANGVVINRAKALIVSSGCSLIKKDGSTVSIAAGTYSSVSLAATGSINPVT